MKPFSKLPAQFTLVDTSSTSISGDILLPFAFEEVLCRKIGEGSSKPIIHIWRHSLAFVLGLRDRRLPHSIEAMNWLEQQGYRVTVRNSGGAAVPLDPGVINISFILPSREAKMSFQEDFQLMYQAIRDSLQRVTPLVNKGEVNGAYCPGDFDLSIHEKKFCGIAQRRQIKAFIIQAFVTVEGSGKERGALVKEFYCRASGGSKSDNHPIVYPETMASLSELTSISSSEEFVHYFKEYLSKNGEVLEVNNYQSLYNDKTLYEDEMNKAMTDFISRYEKRDRSVGAIKYVIK
jgi:octanoyl-[GcvH]:protein N-octanoyltransferase